MHDDRIANVKRFSYIAFSKNADEKESRHIHTTIQKDKIELVIRIAVFGTFLVHGMPALQGTKT